MLLEWFTNWELLLMGIALVAALLGFIGLALLYFSRADN
jgi:hypothetical protein